jgi:predicted nucleotidyltransferase
MLRASRETPNPALMEFFSEEIKPEIPIKLKEIDISLNSLQFPPRRYYLYGSFNRGTPHSRSDIDIAVIAEASIDDKKSLKDLLDDKGIYCRIRGARLEVVVFPPDSLESGFLQDAEEIHIHEESKTGS